MHPPLEGLDTVALAFGKTSDVARDNLYDDLKRKGVMPETTVSRTDSASRSPASSRQPLSWRSSRGSDAEGEVVRFGGGSSWRPERQPPPPTRGWLR